MESTVEKCLGKTLKTDIKFIIQTQVKFLNENHKDLKFISVKNKKGEVKSFGIKESKITHFYLKNSAGRNTSFTV